MVARIKTPSNIIRALNYNEQKVKHKQADLLHASNYLKDADKLSFNDKLKRFQGLISLNDRAKTNSLHISLNFDNADTISATQYIEIANDYMQTIGFANQPYLVYQHHDAGHPHIHIVTTTIEQTGKRINTYNIGRNQSEKARKEIEIRYNLVKAQNGRRINQNLKPVNVLKIEYGKSEIKRAITNVLDYVLNTYKYASLAELNAVLQQYNMIADRGNKTSGIYKNNGLTYRILDNEGHKIGVPIKASLIYNKPTLNTLQAKFKINEKDRGKHKQRVINAVDFCLLKNQKQSIEDLTNALQREKIQIVLRQNDNGIIYGLTYVDNHTKCVFNGSHLGKQYSAVGIQLRCNGKQIVNDAHHNLPTPHILKESFKQPFSLVNYKNDQSIVIPNSSVDKLFNDLLQAEENRNANEPFEQKKFKQKKKRKRQQL